MQTIVCKGCGNQLQATTTWGSITKPSCPVCCGIAPESGIPVTVEHPKQYKCTSCGKTTDTEILLRHWSLIPFAEPASGFYYCGCRGWD